MNLTVHTFEDVGGMASELGCLLLFLSSIILALNMAFLQHYTSEISLRSRTPVLKAMVLFYCSLAILAYVCRVYLDENEFTQLSTLLSGFLSCVCAWYVVPYSLRLYEMAKNTYNANRFKELIRANE